MKSMLNLTEISKLFSDEMAAREKIESMRWPNGPECPTCSQTSTVYRMLKLATSKKPGRPGPDSHKTPVVALVERGGRVRAFPMPRVTSENLSAVLNAHADKGAELMTDDFYAYRSVGEQMARHGVVKHSNKEYVRGNDH